MSEFTHARYLDELNATPFVQALKERALTWLDVRPGHRVLDVGCGLGDDARAMAGLVGDEGHVAGLDPSETMVVEAGNRNRDAKLPASFCQGDAQRLPFADGSFHRCLVNSTFQYLPAPEQALAEVLRVLQPGGKLVAVEPDLEMQVVDTPFTDVNRRFLAFRSDAVAQGGIGHRLYGLFRAAGLEDVTVEPLVRVTTDYAATRLLRFDVGMRLARKHGAVTGEEMDEWLAYVRAAGREGRFFFAIVYFVVAGRKPE